MIVGRSIWQFNLFHISMVGGRCQTFPLLSHSKFDNYCSGDAHYGANCYDIEYNKGGL